MAVRSTRLFAAALLAGLILRLAVLPLPGTFDVTAFKVWTHAAATGPVAEMYGVGGTPPERRLHEYDGWQATVNYPPVALYELKLVGRIYAWAEPGFPNSAWLAACIKALPVAFEAGIAVLLWAAVRRLRPLQIEAPRYAALAFWLNPAAMLATSVLGYVDALFALPALGALVAAAGGFAGWSGVLLALAVLTKPQALIVAPAVGLALLAGSSRRGWLPCAKAAGWAAATAGLTAAAVLTPLVAAGAWPNFIQAMQSLGRHDMLSGLAANVWWIVTYVMRAAYAAADLGVADAFLSPVRRPLAISRIVELGYPSPRFAATLAVLAAAGWGLWLGRRARGLPRLALVGAWSCYAYFVLSVQVHENHFYLILPLLALAAATLEEWRRPFWTLSWIFALNLNLFYGFGDTIGYALPRSPTGIDASVLLSGVNLACFVSFARRLRGALTDVEGIESTTGPAGTLRPPGWSSP